MKRTAVAMMVGSRNSTHSLVVGSVESILNNVDPEGIKLYVGVSSWVEPEIKNYLALIIQQDPRIELYYNYDKSWASFVNLVAENAYKEGFTWLIEAHDDIEVITLNVIQKVEDFLKNIRDPIGWISFHDTGYLNGKWNPSIREGFALDAMKEAAWGRKKVHQFHSLPENWYDPNKSANYFKSLPYDIPKYPIKCHGMFSHFVMINLNTLVLQIGNCEDWSPVSLLIDEDRSLTALQRNLFNIWMPQICYNHVKIAGTRASNQIKEYGPYVHKKFEEKWGFPHKAVYSDIELETIRNKFSGTNISWSMNKRTYNWKYVI